MQWPTKSPNLNPIKNLSKQRLHGRFRNGEELYQTVWSQIKQVQVDKLIESMAHRCTKVIKNYSLNY